MSKIFKLNEFQTLLSQVVVGAGRNSEIFKKFFSITSSELFEICEKNELGAIIGHDCLNRGKYKCFWLAHQKQKMILEAYLEELDKVAHSFLKEKILIVALKNGGIARGIYPCLGCCPMGDIDVLVDEKDFHNAHLILLRSGFYFEFRSPLEEADLKHALKNGGAEYWKILPNGEKLWFELQWRPVAGRWLRPDQEPTAEELIFRSIPIVGTSVRLLSPEDNLLQVALHTAKHTYVRAPGFRLHFDVERIVRYQELDWNLFLRRVNELQVKTAVYFSLLIPFQLFNTPVPEYVIKSLRPPAWKEKLIAVWLNKVGLFGPDEKKFGRIEYIIFNALLYDDVFGFFKGVFPEKKWMKDHYEFNNNLFLPFYYVKRIVNLTLKRLQT